MAYFRKAFKHGGGKSDDTDARSDSEVSANQPRGIAAVGQQTLLRPESLKTLTIHRRLLVDERVALGNRLISLLKC